VFNDSDLQMAGYAAALKVLTGYTHIGGEDVTAFAMRPRVKGEVTVAGERLPSIVVLGDVEIADPWCAGEDCRQNDSGNDSQVSPEPMRNPPFPPNSQIRSGRFARRQAPGSN